MSPRAAGAAFTLGEWRIEPARGVIVGRNQQETRLEPQIMDLLLLFAGAPGEVLSKDRIIASVWKGRAIGDDTLAGAISRLRSALGPGKHIETIPKRGYRLIFSPNAFSVAAATAEPAESMVVRGMAILNAPTPLNLNQAKLYFEAALRDAPSNAAAHAGLAHALLLQHLMDVAPSSAGLQAAEAAARAALATEPEHCLALAVLGFATLLARRNFAEADALLQKALAADPGSIVARRYRGLVLAAAGRLTQAERETRASIAGDPISLLLRAELLQILLLARRYPAAIAEAKRALEIAPASRDIWSARGWAHQLCGDEEQARHAFLQSLKDWGLDRATLETLARAYTERGFAGLCSATADMFETQRMGFIPRLTDIAILRACAGEHDSAIAILNQAADRDDPYLIWVLQLPQLDRLRNDPRFAMLLDRVRNVR